MDKKHERTLKAKKQFLEYRENGLSIAEIAKRCEVSNKTIYNILGDIAEEIGVTRESLLYRPRGLYGISGKKTLQPLERFRFDELLAEIEKIQKDADYIVKIWRDKEC